MKFSLFISIALNIALAAYAIVTWPALKPAGDTGRILAISPYSSSAEIKQAGFNVIDQMRLTNMAETGVMRWIIVFDHGGRMELQPLMEVSTIQNKGGDPMIYIFEQHQGQ